MMFENKRGGRFLSALPRTSLDGEENNLTTRSKFNFSYFTVDYGSQDFKEWTPEQLHKLLHALKDYGSEKLHHWEKQKLGKGSVLAVYGDFPRNSDFKHPPHVPHDVVWGRFRLQSAVRLCGFMVPRNRRGSKHLKTGEEFDCNTFYVVFLDQHHQFYKIEPK
jgi:hypothetical protein